MDAAVRRNQRALDSAVEWAARMPGIVDGAVEKPARDGRVSTARGVDGALWTFVAASGLATPADEWAGLTRFGA
jgi:hypothetical protein